MGTKGSSGATYRYKRECFNCGVVAGTKLVNGLLLCNICAGIEGIASHPSGHMPEPVFTLQEIEISKDLINKLSNS